MSHDPDEISRAFKKHCSKCDTWIRLLFIACQQMEIGTKPIPISVLTAVTNSALNAASVFPSRRIEISDSYTDLNRSADAAWSAQPFDGDPKFCSRVYKPSPECGGITSEHCEFVGRAPHRAAGRGRNFAPNATVCARRLIGWV